jgi:hypothetical protein
VAARSGGLATFEMTLDPLSRDFLRVCVL